MSASHFPWHRIAQIVKQKGEPSEFMNSRLLSTFTLLASVFLGTASSLEAQAPGTVDPLDAKIAPNNSLMDTMAVQPDGKIIIAGNFTSVHGVSRRSVARLNVDGTLDMVFDPNVNGAVIGLAVQPDGKVVLAGSFSALQPNGATIPTTRNNIARVNSDGTLDMGFDPNTDSTVDIAVVQADGKIILAGGFDNLRPNGAASSTARKRIARVNSDGTLDSFNPRPDASVASMALQPDGKVVMGGNFSLIGFTGTIGSGTPRAGIARVNSDGSLDTSFNPPKPSANVLCVALQADGKVLLGGVFTTILPSGAPAPIPRRCLARLNSDGTFDAAFDPETSDNVYSIALQADGKVLLGGTFTSLQPNGAPAPTMRQHVARINADGTIDAAFDPNANGIPAETVALQADGKVLLGGGFTALRPNGTPTPIPRFAFARLYNDPATEALSVSSPSRVLWQRGGSSPDFTRVFFELSVDGGVNWSLLGSGFRVGTTANWQLTSLNLPATGLVRARGVTAGAFLNAGYGLVESVTNFNFDIAITQAGPLTDGAGNVAFGTVTLGGSTAPKTFTITNPGTADLTSLTIVKDGPHASDFQVSAVSNTTIPVGSGTTTFTVTFTPGGQGLRNAGLHIASNVPGAKNPFDITLVGNGNAVPTLSLPVSPFIAEATGANGTAVTFQIFANDIESGLLIPAVNPSSGSLFPIGDSTVQVSATDGDGATTNGSFVIRVRDTSPPMITVPAVPVTAQALGPGGAVVTFAVGANDLVDGPVPAVPDHASGSLFPPGDTVVHVTASDSRNNTGNATFIVRVVDLNAPIITVLGANPASVEASLTYADAGATANDAVAGDLTAAIQVTNNVNAHTPGNYTVTYSVSDGFNTATATRAVQVIDTTGPTITHLPDPLTLTGDATNHASLPDLTGQVTATDFVGVTSIVQSPAPGALLAYGSHTVTFTAEDAAHNTATGSMVVTVADGPALTGRYAGLLAITQSGGGNQEFKPLRANGRVEPTELVRSLMELKLTKGRFLTGFLRHADGRRMWLPGTILPAATHATTLALNDSTSLALEFDGSGHVSASLVGGALPLSGEGVLADAGAPGEVPGTYTAILEADGATAPGWLYCVVSKRGAMRISGKLPDGSTINAGQGSIVDRHGDALIFMLGRRTRALLSGGVRFENLPTSDFSGALAFNDLPCAANGARFTPAPSGLPTGDYPISLTGAGFNIASTVTLLPNNTATFLAPITKFYPRSSPGKPATGIFYTTFHANGAPIRPVTRGSGIFHQKLGIGSGQFPHAGSIGRIQLGVLP